MLILTLKPYIAQDVDIWGVICLQLFLPIVQDLTGLESPDETQKTCLLCDSIYPMEQYPSKIWLAQTLSAFKRILVFPPGAWPRDIYAHCENKHIIV